MPNKKYNYIREYFTFDGVKYEVYGKTKDEAIEKKILRLQELEAGRMDSNKTVKDWADVWYREYVQPRKEQGHVPRLPGSGDHPGDRAAEAA